MMKNILALLSKKPSKGLLVLKCDCLSLRATVIKGQADKLNVLASVMSWETDPVVALTDVITQLKNQLGPSLPSEAILMHINAIPNLVEITENTNSATPTNLAEMMRWEMDGVVADLSPVWDLGWILLGRGYLTQEQRDRLLELAMQEKALSSRHTGGKALRVGELAVRERMATQEQVKDCLQLQEKLQLPDQSLITQWRPVPKMPSEFSTDDTFDATQHYICSAMPIAQHLQWINAFNKVSGNKGLPKLKLKQVYPIAGSTLTLPEIHDEVLMVTEFHPAYALCALLENGVIQDIVTLKASSYPLEIDLVVQTLQSGRFADAERWLIANVDGQTLSFFDELEGRINLRAEYLPKASRLSLDVPATVKNNVLAELGAASHFFGRGPLLVSPLGGTPPPEPFYRRQGVRVAASIALVPMIIGGFEVLNQWEISSLRDELIEKEKTLSGMGDQREISQSDIDKMNQNIELYKGLEQELAGLQYQKQLVQQVMLKRQNFVEKILPTLSHSINDGVILDSMVETDWYHFTLTGRSIDQSSIDDFYRVLSINLQPLQMTIVDNPSRLDQGNVTQAGIYAFEFTLRQQVMQ
jgi:hypothetical protein